MPRGGDLSDAAGVTSHPVDERSKRPHSPPRTSLIAVWEDRTAFSAVRSSQTAINACPASSCDKTHPVPGHPPSPRSNG